MVWRFLGEVTTPCPGIAVPKNAMYPFKPCRPSLPRTSVGLRRIVGTCQDPWSLASFPLWSSLDARYQAESDICGFSSRRQSLLLLCTPAVVFLHTRIFNGTLVTCVFSRKCQCGQICSRWRSYNIVYIKLSVHNMIHLYFPLVWSRENFKTSSKKIWYSFPIWHYCSIYDNRRPLYCHLTAPQIEYVYKLIPNFQRLRIRIKGRPF